MYYKIVCSVKLGDMLVNNQILSCMVYWCGCTNGHEQLQNNFKKVSLLCVCYSMHVTVSTKINGCLRLCHLVGRSTSFHVVVLGDWCCKMILCSTGCCCCRRRRLQLAVFPCNQPACFYFLSILLVGVHEEDSFTNKLDLTLRKKLTKCCVLSVALYGAETWTLRKIDLKYPESFAMLWKDGDQWGRLCRQRNIT
jgi:hypothetical protein